MKENNIEEDIKIAVDKFSDNKDIDSAMLIVEKFILGNYILLGGNRGNIVKDSLRYILSDYKKVLKENEQLRTEVNSLKEEKEQYKNDYFNLYEQNKQYIHYSKIEGLAEKIHNKLDKNGITRAYQTIIDSYFDEVLGG